VSVGNWFLLANQLPLSPRSRQSCVPQLAHQLIDTPNLNSVLSPRHRRPININKTLPTLPPPTRFGGSLTVIVSSRGARSTPRSAGVNFSTGFFFAFMMLGNDAYRGSLRNLNPQTQNSEPNSDKPTVESDMSAQPREMKK
jgi:hypothetical protein